MASVEIHKKSYHRLIQSIFISLTMFVYICAVQVIGAKELKLEIQTDLLKAICVQSEAFSSSKTVQLALKNKNTYKHVAHYSDKACGGVICTKKGGKCESVNEKCTGLNKKKTHKLKTLPSSGSKNSNGTCNAYKGYKVYRATPKDDFQLKSLTEMENSGVDFWTEPSNTINYCDFMLSPEQQKHYLPITRKAGIQMKEILADVNKLLQNEKVAKAVNVGDLSWDAFYDLDDIYAFIESLEKKYPNNAKVITYGESYEKRQLKLISIFTSTSSQRQIVFIVCNIHAREYITNALCTFLINDILVDKKECISSFLSKFDFYLIPVANPDGYVYSHQPSGDLDNFRLWRKTTSLTPGSHCIGADPNRNFDVHWNGAYEFYMVLIPYQSGTLSNPCTQSYGGTRSSSEAEVEHLQNYLLTPEISSRIRVFLDIHSKEQTLLWPWSYDQINVTKEHYQFFWETSQKAVDAIKVRYATQYTHGPASQAFGAHSGTAFDWVYDKILQTKTEAVFSGTFELRNGPGGFIVEGKDILPHILEAMDGICVVIEVVGSRGGEGPTIKPPTATLSTASTASITQKPGHTRTSTASFTTKLVNTSASITKKPAHTSASTASTTKKPVNLPTSTEEPDCQ